MGCKMPIKFILAAFIGTVLIIFGVGTALPAHAGAVFVVNPSVPVDTLSKSDVKKIFLGKKIIWKDDTEIQFVILKKSDIHKDFAKTYTSKTESQFERYWKKQVFTGKGSAPKSFGSEADLIKYVADTEGAIGYASPNAKADGVKIITITD